MSAFHTTPDSLRTCVAVLVPPTFDDSLFSSLPLVTESHVLIKSNSIPFITMPRCWNMDRVTFRDERNNDMRRGNEVALLCVGDDKGLLHLMFGLYRR